MPTVTVALLSLLADAAKAVEVELVPYVEVPVVATASSKVPPLPGCGSPGAPCWSPHSASAELVSPIGYGS